MKPDTDYTWIRGYRKQNWHLARVAGGVGLKAICGAATPLPIGRSSVNCWLRRQCAVCLGHRRQLNSEPATAVKS